MRREENAYALASLLQQRKFPAFAFKGKAEHFYEVFVGPYADPNVAAKTQKELQDQGVATVIRHWPLRSARSRPLELPSVREGAFVPRHTSIGLDLQMYKAGSCTATLSLPIEIRSSA